MTSSMVPVEVPLNRVCVTARHELQSVREGSPDGYPPYVSGRRTWSESIDREALGRASWWAVGSAGCFFGGILMLTHPRTPVSLGLLVLVSVFWGAAVCARQYLAVVYRRNAWVTPSASAVSTQIAPELDKTE